MVVESAVARGQRWKKPVYAESGELEKNGVSVREILGDSYSLSD